MLAYLSSSLLPSLDSINVISHPSLLSLNSIIVSSRSSLPSLNRIIVISRPEQHIASSRLQSHEIHSLIIMGKYTSFSLTLCHNVWRDQLSRPVSSIQHLACISQPFLACTIIYQLSSSLRSSAMTHSSRNLFLASLLSPMGCPFDCPGMMQAWYGECYRAFLDTRSKIEKPFMKSCTTRLLSIGLPIISRI